MEGPGAPVRLAQDLEPLIAAYIQDCYRSQRFCDLTLRGADGAAGSVSCHRCVVAAVFPPLQGILDTPEATVDLLLPDFALSHIRALVDRIYSPGGQKVGHWSQTHDALASTLNAYDPCVPPVPRAPAEDAPLLADEGWAERDPECPWFPDRLAWGSEATDEPQSDWDPGQAWHARLSEREDPAGPSPVPGQSQRTPRCTHRPRRAAGGKGEPARGPRGRKRGRKGAKPPAVKRFKAVTHLDHSNFDNLEALKNTLRCDCPGLSFNNLKEQQSHFYSVHCQHEFTICDTCGHPVRTYHIQAHRESCASEVGPFLCPECGKEFPRRCNLNSHVFSYHKPVQCKSCGEQFVGNMLKRIHERTQHVKSFNCDHCPLQFNTMLKKKSHMVSVHLPDHLRPHVCLDCGQGFLYEDKLKRHRMNKHIRSRPFACRCGCVDVAYNDQSTRNQHENRNHPDHPIVVDRMTNKVPRSKPKVRTTS